MASEWADIRFRSGEKTSYKDLNKSPQIRFPIPVNLDIPAHKVSLIIQSQLGSVNLPVNEKASSNLFQYQTDTFLVFQHLRRLIRCVIDFKYAEGDSVALRNALFMCRSIGARCWDDSPMVLKQLEKIGPAGVLKLVKAGVRSVEALENTEPHRIEMALNRNPPFGMQVVAAARAFPKLRISVSVLGKPVSIRAHLQNRVILAKHDNRLSKLVKEQRSMLMLKSDFLTTFLPRRLQRSRCLLCSSLRPRMARAYTLRVQGRLIYI